ncbi:MAG: GNAT family N-acetyltransferase [Planctomycetota bacterium]
MTDAEFGHVKAGFDELAQRFGAPPIPHERFGFVAEDDDGRFLGAASGLAYPHRRGVADWFQITDLFVEEWHRSQGIATTLMAASSAG